MQVRAQWPGPGLDMGRFVLVAGSHLSSRVYTLASLLHPHFSLPLKPDSTREQVGAQAPHPCALLPGHSLVGQGWVESRVKVYLEQKGSNCI